MFSDSIISTISTDHYTVLVMFYRAVFGLKV